MGKALRMPDTRTAQLAGRLGRQPELAYSAEGMAYCTLRLAVTVPRKGENDTLWMDVKCFGKTAERAAELPKGAAVSVEGRLDVERWRDPQGEGRSKTVVMADRVQPLEWADDVAGAGSGEPIQEDDIPF